MVSYHSSSAHLVPQVRLGAWVAACRECRTMHAQQWNTSGWTAMCHRRRRQTSLRGAKEISSWGERCALRSRAVARQGGASPCTSRPGMQDSSFVWIFKACRSPWSAAPCSTRHCALPLATQLSLFSATTRSQSMPTTSTAISLWSVADHSHFASIRHRAGNCPDLCVTPAKGFCHPQHPQHLHIRHHSRLHLCNRSHSKHSCLKTKILSFIPERSGC
mmetsp:Transcript_12959/g.33212  ORF Transcript_12959/g.33212 Transcript_12959/m.33212 type:complete len:218 (-) Transcript_12959:950-1603(-)